MWITFKKQKKHIRTVHSVRAAKSVQKSGAKNNDPVAIMPNEQKVIHMLSTCYPHFLGNEKYAEIATKVAIF